MDSRDALLAQALLDAEIVRAPVETTWAVSQAAYDAARDSLRSSRDALTAATRTPEVLGRVVTCRTPDPPRPDLRQRTTCG